MRLLGKARYIVGPRTNHILRSSRNENAPSSSCSIQVRRGFEVTIRTAMAPFWWAIIPQLGRRILWRDLPSGLVRNWLTGVHKLWTQLFSAFFTVVRSRAHLVRQYIIPIGFHSRIRPVTTDTSLSAKVGRGYRRIACSVTL